MTVHVLLFASVAEKAGIRSLDLPLSPGDRIADVRERLFTRYPELRPFQDRLVYALDEVYARADEVVPSGSTLALIPPVSGG